MGILFEVLRIGDPFTQGDHNILWPLYLNAPLRWWSLYLLVIYMVVLLSDVLLHCVYFIFWWLYLVSPWCTVLYYVRDNSPWWANVHCKSNLTINKLSYSYSYSYSWWSLYLVGFLSDGQFLYGDHLKWWSFKWWDPFIWWLLCLVYILSDGSYIW